MHTDGINPKAIMATNTVNLSMSATAMRPDPSRAGNESEEALLAALIVLRRISGAEDPNAINVTAAISSGTVNSSIMASTAAQCQFITIVIVRVNSDLAQGANQQQCKWH